MENKKVRDEIPDTEQGLITYISYAEKQIKENLLHNGRLKTRLKWCYEKLEKYDKSEDNNDGQLNLQTNLRIG